MRDRSTPVRTVSGAPLVAVRIPVSCQPPRTAVRALFPRGDGTIQTEEMARIWVRSVGINPLSRFQLLGSRVPSEPSPCDDVCPMSFENVYEASMVKPRENRLLAVNCKEWYAE